MKVLYSLSVVGLSALSVRAQSGLYGQCGGTGWTGATTCVSGAVCTYANAYYSQCLPSTGATSTTKTTSTTSTTKTTSTSATATSSVDTTSHCGQWDSVAAGPYSMLLDLWGESGATSGSQCSNLISLSGDTVAWTTTWTWTGGSGVKSFSNIQRNTGINKQLSAISSIPTTWKWSYSLTSTSVTDVAYDLFTSSTSGGSGENEIMVWLDNFRAGPIAQSWDATGKPVPTVSNISLAGFTWNLYTGSNGYNNVFSFLLADGSTNTNFSADINLFLKYLTSNGYFSSSQYLVTAQAGTEPTSGTGTLTTSSYSLVIN